MSFPTGDRHVMNSFTCEAGLIMLMGGETGREAAASMRMLLPKPRAP